MTANRYPFAKSDRDVPMADFANMFAPGGTIDRFFSTNLAPLVNLSSKTWTWRPNPMLTRKLSDTTLRQFQQAAEIRDAFFPTGGNQPTISLEVKPLTHERRGADRHAADQRRVGGRPAGDQHAVDRCSGRARARAPPRSRWRRNMPDRVSKLERTGAWALFRLLDAGSVLQRGNAVSASFVIGGREVSYQFTAASLNNPLSMPSLRQFKCPNGL